MRQWNVPVAERRCGVLVIAQPHDLRHFILQISPVERQVCLAILHETASRIINRVAAQNEKLLDPAVVDVRRQL